MGKAQIEPPIKPAKVYLSVADYNRLQSLLRAEGSDVSKWFREQVKKFLAKHTDG